MIRIEVEDSVDAAYLHAFLISSTGQALLRRDSHGSVIDHITVNHALNMPLSWPRNGVRRRVAAHVVHATLLRERARLTFAQLTDEIETHTPSPALSQRKP